MEVVAQVGVAAEVASVLTPSLYERRDPTPRRPDVAAATCAVPGRARPNASPILTRPARSSRASRLRGFSHDLDVGMVRRQTEDRK